MQYQGLDNKFTKALPEGVSITFTPAGITVRSCAYLIDFTIRALVIMIAGFALSSLGRSGEGVVLILYFVTSWGYNIFFEARNGQTPGKKRFGLRVVQDNGLPASLKSVILRNLLRPADAFPFAYILGILTMAFGRDFKRIGDWASGTIVIHEEKQQALDFSFAQQGAAPPFALSTEEQNAVISFAERSKDLSPARQAELANILSSPLKAQDEQASAKLKQVAQYYIGQEI